MTDYDGRESYGRNRPYPDFVWTTQTEFETPLTGEIKYTRHLQKQPTLDGTPMQVKERLLPREYQQPLSINELHCCYHCIRCEPYGGCGARCIYCFILDHNMSLYSANFDMLKCKKCKQTFFTHEEANEHKKICDGKVELTSVPPGIIRPSDLSQMRWAFKRAYDRSDRGDTLVQAIRKGIPIHMSVLTDPFQPLERRYKRTLEAIKIMNEYEHPFVISTKFDLARENPWYNAISEAGTDKVIVQSSFSTVNPKLAKILEPGASSPYARLEMLKTFKQVGFRTVARNSPVIPKIGMEFIANSGILHGKPTGLLNNIRAQNAYDVDGTLFFSLFVSGNKTINKYYKERLGIDMLRLYQDLPHIFLDGCQYHLAHRLILEAQQPAKELANELGMFANYDGPVFLYPLGDMYNCCGGDGLEPFSPPHLNNVNFRGAWYAVQRHGTMTLEEYLKLFRNQILSPTHLKETIDMWNRLLWSVIGMKIVGKDEQDNLVYEYVKPEDDVKLKEVDVKKYKVEY